MAHSMVIVNNQKTFFRRKLYLYIGSIAQLVGDFETNGVMGYCKRNATNYNIFRTKIIFVLESKHCDAIESWKKNLDW